MFENNFCNTAWKVQRNPVFHPHIPSLRLLPSRIQGTRCDNQWPYSDTLLSPKVHVSYQAHACCRACFGQIDSGECSGSEVWVEDVHCPANPYALPAFLPPPCPLATTDLFTASLTFDISRKSCLWNHTEYMKYSDWLLSEGGIFKVPPCFFKAF